MAWEILAGNMFLFASYVIERIRGVKESLPRLPQVDWFRTYSVHHVPEPFHEPGIITGYRHTHCSVFQAVVSVFIPNNEMMNFWTHFIPGLYFLHLATTGFPSSGLADPFLLPFTCYLYSACGYMFTSSFAHTFSCVSLWARYLCFFFDYIGVSMYSWGAALLCYSYTFPSNLMAGWVARIFLPLAAVNCLGATFCSCLSRFCEKKGMRTLLRLGAYAVPAVWIGVFLIMWIREFLMTEGKNDDVALPLHLAHLFFLLAGATFYGSHFPECMAPGSFDNFGHSHSLFHVCVATATYFEMIAGLETLKLRRITLEAARWMPSPEWITVVTPALVAIQVVMVMVFARLMHIRIKTAPYRPKIK